MPSMVAICNQALGHINRNAIASLDERTQEAIICNRLYNSLREVVLGDFPWGFATKYAELAQLDGSVYGNWSYCYAVPTDCLVIRRIHNPAGEYPQIEYSTAVSADLTKKTILTNQPGAVLVYTANVVDPNVFDSAFSDALTWRLTADIALPLKADPALQQSAFKMYLYLVGAAQQKNAGEGFKLPVYDSMLSRSRG